MKTPKKILIIEDEKDLVTLLSNALKEESFEILYARNGLDGLSIAKEKRPDLVLLDLDIPGIDGLTVLEKIRENEETKDMAVIVFSNSADVANLSKAIDQGVLYYLAKSNWEIEDVVEKIKEVLSLQ